MCFGKNLLVKFQHMIEETEKNNLSMGILSGQNAVCLTHALRLFQSLGLFREMRESLVKCGIE
jgi:hypothetical protein